MESDDRIKEAIRRTQILRHPKQTLYTFGTTTINYYLLTEPVYTDPDKDVPETVIREGKVTAEKPKIVTPYYLMRLDGFGPEAKRYFGSLVDQYGPDAPGIFYAYRNEPKDTTIASENIRQIVDRLNGEIDRRNDPLAAIIRGEDVLWDVSIMKFIFEITRRSFSSNLNQFGERGMLGVDNDGVPTEAKRNIERMIREVRAGKCAPEDLRDELERWGLFEEYQDRFLELFKKKD